MKVYSTFMRALVWVVSALSAVVGFSAISVAIFGTLRARSKSPYVLLIVFYGAYTLQTFFGLLQDFVLSGGNALPVRLVWSSYALNSLLGVAVVAAAALYFHELFAVKGRRARDLAVLAAAFAVVALFALPSAVRIEPRDKVMVLGSLAYAAEAVYLSLFAYLLIVGFAGSKRDRPARELVLIWATLAFGSVGLAESGKGALQLLRSPVIELAYSEGSFSISLIPHILMGFVMIYYFGGYILADRLPPDGTVPDSFIKRFAISLREREVIVLMERGLSNREIAEKLFVSLATVKTHAHNIYEKTGAKSRYGLSHMIRGARG